MVIKTILEMTKTLERVLSGGKIDLKKQEILDLFQKQFKKPEDKKTNPEFPKINLNDEQEIKVVEKRAQEIFQKLIKTPVIQKCLEGFDFKLNVSENSEPDAYEDNAHLLLKQAKPTLNTGLFNLTFYPKDYTKKDIDACVAYVLAHELGHTVVALHTPSLQAQEIQGGFTKEEKRNPENQKIQRGIEFICDSMGAIACQQADFPCDRFEAIAKFGRVNNPTHTSYFDMCQLNRLIRQDFSFQMKKLKSNKKENK